MPRTPRPAAALALAAVLLLAACGGDDGALTVTNQAPTSSLRPLEPTPAAPSVAGSPTADAAGSVTFAGVTVTKALDVRAEPGITARNTAPAPGLLVQDLVVGTGVFATATAKATVHYRGVLYADGTEFDTNYGTADPAPQDLGKAINGFAQGVGGTKGVPPMRVGGRRLMVFPASLGYGAVPEGKIPAHASLVFVVDLLGVS